MRNYSDNAQRAMFQELRENLDSYAFTGLVSEDLGIGTGADKLTSFQDTYFKRIMPETAKRLYANSDVLQNIVDIPALDATREGFELTSDWDADGASDMISERLEELKIKEVLQKHLENYNLFSHGSIILPVIKENHNRNKDYLMRKSINDIQRIEALNVLGEEDFSVLFNVIDPFSPNYKKPEQFFIRGVPVNPNRLHWSVYKFFPLEHEGVSMLGKVLLASLALRVTNWSLATVMVEIQNKVLKVENLSAYSNQTADFANAQVNQRGSVINVIKNWMTSHKLLVIDKNDEYSRDMYSAAGIKETTDFFWEYLSAVTGMPQSAIKGQAQGTISTADTDALRYAEKIRTVYQYGVLKESLDFIIEYLKFEKTGKFFRTFGLQAQEIKFNIEFNQIWKPDAKEESEINLRNTQRGQIDIATGVRDPEQVRAENYPHLKDEPLPVLPETTDEPFDLEQSNRKLGMNW